jgi:hypothetical protein
MRDVMRVAGCVNSVRADEPRQRRSLIEHLDWILTFFLLVRLSNNMAEKERK